MGNISFSKVGEAILANKALANHITRRMASLTPEENKAGQFDVKFKNGIVVTFKFGASEALAAQNTLIADQGEKPQIVALASRQKAEPA